MRSCSDKAKFASKKEDRAVDVIDSQSSNVVPRLVIERFCSAFESSGLHIM